jgi:adenylate cyclase
MFTDIVGYTTLGQRNESASLALVKEQRKLVRPILTRHKGREIKTMGDAFLIEFPSALEAVRCGYDIQRAAREFNISMPEERRINLRIGIHLGDVVESHGDISGDAMNVASRIEALAEAGGVCLTRQVYDHVQNKFELPMESLGAKPLKNVSTPVEVYRIVMPWIAGKPSTMPLDRRRIAVLPFANISQNTSDEYFADGMTEELISTMSKISGLRVIARTSVMGYKGGQKKVSEVAKELEVGTVLEGSVRKAGDRLRITVQLIDSQTSEHLWTESYDRELKDIFEIQANVSKAVANALEVQLLTKESAAIGTEPTSNAEAHDLCLKGIYCNLEKYDNRKAVEYLEQAVKLDPTYALAYAWLADSYASLVTSSELSFDEGMPKAERAVSKALELGPNLPETHTAMMTVLGDKLDFQGAEAEARKAIRINPNFALGHGYLSGILSFYGDRRLDEALIEARKALELDPLGRFANVTIMARLLYSIREYDKAIEHLKKIREFDPDFKQVASLLGWCYLQKSQFAEAIKEFQSLLDPSKGKADLNLTRLACAYAKSGRREEAVRILNDLEEVSKSEFIPANRIFFIHLALGNNDEAFRLMQEAFDKKEYESLYWTLMTDPIYDEVRSDPRFKSLAHRLNLA